MLASNVSLDLMEFVEKTFFQDTPLSTKPTI